MLLLVYNVFYNLTERLLNKFQLSTLDKKRNPRLFHPQFVNFSSTFESLLSLFWLFLFNATNCFFWPVQHLCCFWVSKSPSMSYFLFFCSHKKTIKCGQVKSRRFHILNICFNIVIRAGLRRGTSLLGLRWVWKFSF